MNPVQRIYMKLLAPLGNFMNNNISNRSGLIGKFGRFWSIGNRQYGYHPSSRYFKLINNYMMNFLKFMWSGQSFSKTVMQKQNYVNGYFALFRVYYYGYGLILLMIPYILLGNSTYMRKIFFLYC